MYTISRFSQLCKMSARMLRHYDKEELLKPVHVDTLNGYRYYDKSQLETALRIKKLKEYQFSLPEIKTILQAADNQLFMECIRTKINELSLEVNRYKQIIAEMQEMMERKTDILWGERRVYDILLGIRNEVSVISQSMLIHLADMDKYMDALYAKAEENRIHVVGAPSVVFFDEEFTPERSNIELMIPILHGKGEDASNDWQIKQHPEQFVATTIHFGSYDDIGYAHMALEEWTDSHGYGLDGPPYETYLKGPECDCLAEEYVNKFVFLS